MKIVKTTIVCDIEECKSVAPKYVQIKVQVIVTDMEFLSLRDLDICWKCYRRIIKGEAIFRSRLQPGMDYEDDKNIYSFQKKETGW